MKILVTIGTRPEAIKLAPVVKALQADDRFQTLVCSTGQHREMLAQVLDLFSITPDIDLDLMQPDQTLAGLHAKAMEKLDQIYKTHTPEMVLVQGDTSTAMVAALAAFYLDIPVGHVEAGLRTDDIRHPFPEEANRRIISAVTRLNFAPTERSCNNLRREGHSEPSIVLTGNTVIDALLWVRQQLTEEMTTPYYKKDLRLILVTVHRRESFGEPMRNIYRALRELAEKNPDIWMLYPVHLNPNVRQTAEQMLGNHERIQLVDPLPYDQLVAAMDACTLILTDSGGIQEEAPSLGKPVLILREKTERPEAIEAGTSILVGRDPNNIIHEAERLLLNTTIYEEIAKIKNPFGDGQASEKILNALLQFQSD